MTVHKIKIVIKKYKNIYVLKATALKKILKRLTEDADADDDDADENLHHPLYCHPSIKRLD